MLVIWNRYAHWESAADRFEAQGGTVLVAENGYVNGRHDGGDYYAIARRFHNGRGQWHVGGPERWTALGAELKPWRNDGDHILVAANRSFGARGAIMPTNWAEDVERRLKKLTKRPIVKRLHPGNNAPGVPLDRHLRNAWAVVIWSSSVGVRALIEGIPVVCEAPWWICKAAAGAALHMEVETPYMGERQAALNGLAWAQWTVNEIASGEPFRYLLRAAGQEKVAAGA